MERDFQTRRYIAKQTEGYSRKLTDVLTNAFDMMCKVGDHNGCLSTSVALHVILRSLGYEPKLCYGLCTGPDGNEIYHAWLELDDKVIDLAIYGNSRWSPFWHGRKLNAVVLEEYANTELKYNDHLFDRDWDGCMISMIVKLGSIREYIKAAPAIPHPSNNGMWAVIFAFLGESYTKNRHEELEQYVSAEHLYGPIEK